MASRMKRIFHRKKDENTSPPQHGLAYVKSDPTLGTSLYESTMAGDIPHTGDYPIRGNNSSVALQQGRESSVRSRRSSGSHYNDRSPSPTPETRHNPRTLRKSPPRAENIVNPKPFNPHLQKGPPPPIHQEGRQKRLSRTPLPEDFASLSLGDQSAPKTTQTVTSNRRSDVPNTSRYASQVPTDSSPRGPSNRFSNVPTTSQYVSQVPTDSSPRGLSNRLPDVPTTSQYVSQVPTDNSPRGSRAQPRTQPASQQPYLYPSSQQPSVSKTPLGSHVKPTRQPRDGWDMKRQQSIPRKQVAPPALSHDTPGPAQASQGSGIPFSNYQENEKALAPAPLLTNAARNSRNREPVPQRTSVLEKNRLIAQGATGPKNAQEVVERAKTNTYDTQIVETVAPAVVHETVQKEVHHIREEHITREIHNHEIYHRILPVIDVEVLPPRHFLPVEGGGLVEITSDEVPSRGKSWVIAETVSKVPSDQPPPQGPRQFTARAFPGTEGDTVRYTAPEGYETTEQTWVHPPELETGARDTGQTWPFVFDKDTPEKGTYGATTGDRKASGSKRHHRISSGHSKAVQAKPSGRTR